MVPCCLLLSSPSPHSNLYNINTNRQTLKAEKIRIKQVLVAGQTTRAKAKDRCSQTQL